MGIHPSRVHQLEKAAFRKIRRALGIPEPVKPKRKRALVPA